MEAQQTKHQVVLSYWRSSNFLVTFRKDDTEPVYAGVDGFGLPMQVWEDMGQPMEITVTVEPGDKLNEDTTYPEPQMEERG